MVCNGVVYTELYFAGIYFIVSAAMPGKGECASLPGIPVTGVRHAQRA